MKIRHILPFALFCLVAASAFGQTKGIAGKWGTDGAAAKTAMAVMLDLKVDASNKITGSIAEYANALCGSPDTILPIDSGMVDGKVATFVTTRPNANACPAAGAAIAPGTPGTSVTWTATLGDDDSMSVTRAVAGGRGGGRGGPGGGAPGAGGGRGGGAPGAGGPPAGGAPPAAAGGAPAGGGAPGGGGRGGGRGGGALVMHRLP